MNDFTPAPVTQSGANSMKDQMDALTLSEENNMMQMYGLAAKQSEAQSWAQTLGGLAEDAAKAKPQV